MRRTRNLERWILKLLRIIFLKQICYMKIVRRNVFAVFLKFLAKMQQKVLQFLGSPMPKNGNLEERKRFQKLKLRIKIVELAKRIKLAIFARFSCHHFVVLVSETLPVKSNEIYTKASEFFLSETSSVVENLTSKFEHF